MCLAVPAKVTKLLPNQRAIANIGGVEKEIALSLVHNVNEGDYVILHVGYALAKLDEQEAQKTLALFAQMQQTGRHA